MKRILKLHWNPYIERWVITDAIGKNVFELPDCYNVYALSDGKLDKGATNLVELEARVVSTEPRTNTIGA